MEGIESHRPLLHDNLKLERLAVNFLRIKFITNLNRILKLAVWRNVNTEILILCKAIELRRAST